MLFCCRSPAPPVGVFNYKINYFVQAAVSVIRNSRYSGAATVLNIIFYGDIGWYIIIAVSVNRVHCTNTGDLINAYNLML